MGTWEAGDAASSPESIRGPIQNDRKPRGLLLGRKVVRRDSVLPNFRNGWTERGTDVLRNFKGLPRKWVFFSWKKKRMVCLVAGWGLPARSPQLAGESVVILSLPLVTRHPAAGPGMGCHVTVQHTGRQDGPSLPGPRKDGKSGAAGGLAKWQPLLCASLPAGG